MIPKPHQETSTTRALMAAVRMAPGFARHEPYTKRAWPGLRSALATAELAALLVPAARAGELWVADGSAVVNQPVGRRPLQVLPGVVAALIFGLILGAVSVWWGPAFWIGSTLFLVLATGGLRLPTFFRMWRHSRNQRMARYALDAHTYLALGYRSATGPRPLDMRTALESAGLLDPPYVLVASNADLVTYYADAYGMSLITDQPQPAWPQSRLMRRESTFSD